MYTLKGIFPEPKKEHKKNFIKENMKQLKYIQGKSPTEPKLTLKSVQPPRLTSTVTTASLGKVKSSPLDKNGRVSLNINKAISTNSRKKHSDVWIKKGDMAEFLKRKEQRQSAKLLDEVEDEDVKSSESSGRLRDIACQTIESNLANKLAESTRLTMLYPQKEFEDEAKLKASGDSSHRRKSPSPHTPNQSINETELDGNRSRLNAILERKDNKDPYLPSGYQKGVLPKYLRNRKENGQKEAETSLDDADQSACPTGHVTLPDSERKETLRMLRNSFAELVNELNKMPVKTDTLRMRNRKMELEKQLSKLEEGIKVFSRPKVFVKIGE